MYKGYPKGEGFFFWGGGGLPDEIGRGIERE